MQELALPEIGHLDFELSCTCKKREILSPAKFFGLIPAKLGKYVKCGRVARYSAVSRCCGDQVLLCRPHRISEGGWTCLRCRHSSSSIDAALLISAM